jgi:LacI family transcriptional regulator
MASRAAKSGKTIPRGPDRPRSRRPTILDVARLARVGSGTVSRVINKNPSVTAEVRQTVENAIAQLGYEPDTLARSMRRTRTRNVGCIFRNLSLARTAPFLDGASSVFSQAGSTMVLGLAKNREAILAHIRSFSRHRIDGVLLYLDEEPDLGILDAITQLQLKVVLINERMPAMPRAVLVDYRAAVTQALRCLADFGHRRVALLSGDVYSYMRQSLFGGFIDAHKSIGLHLDEDLIRFVETGLHVGARETAALLAKESPPTAIIISGDPLLAGAARGIASKGLVVGRDVSLVAMGDSDLAELMTPPITAVRWDVREMGRVAARLLMDSFENAESSAPQPILMPADLVLRLSCQRALK